jgi:hypothetical protein
MAMEDRRYDGVLGVYALMDPRTDVVMYVGQSLNVGARYRDHCNPQIWCHNAERRAWIFELRQQDLMPILRLLRQCDGREIDQAEKDFIRDFKAIGQCELNITGGGKGWAPDRSARTKQDEWVELGHKVNDARLILGEIEQMVDKMAGSGTSRKVTSIRVKTEQLQLHLQGILLDKFANWDHAIRAFNKRQEPHP